MDKYEWMMNQIVGFFKEEDLEAEWDHFTDEDIPYADDDIYWLRVNGDPVWTKPITQSELDGCNRIKDLSVLATEAYLEYVEYQNNLERLIKLAAMGVEEGDLL